MTYATIPGNALLYARPGDPMATRYRLTPSPSMAIDIRHETQAIRGAIFGVMLSLPLWAVTLTLAYWLIG